MGIEFDKERNGNLSKLSEDWNEINSIILFGAGTVSRICMHLFEKVNIKISYVVDSDKSKQGSYWNEYPVVSYEAIEPQRRKQKIVIMTAHTAYNEISQYLTSKGLKEYNDYCGIGQFICEWFWNAKGMNCLYHVDMTVTTRCNFKCKNCNMFIPYYSERRDCTFEEIKNNVDLLFSRVNYIVYFALVGGEPTLNPALKEILNYIGEHYREKCGRLAYVINGSIIPSDDTIQVMKKYDIHLLISNYTEYIPYKGRFDELIKKLKEHEILFDVRYSQIWTDFGFPFNPVGRNEEELKNHLFCCHPEWNGLNDGKFYYCNVSWSAEKSGHYKLKSEDYIDLKNINPADKEACHKIVELSRGTSSFCKICGGCGRDNTNYVEVGRQLVE